MNSGIVLGGSPTAAKSDGTPIASKPAARTVSVLSLANSAGFHGKNSELYITDGMFPAQWIRSGLTLILALFTTAQILFVLSLYFSIRFILTSGFLR